MKTKPDREVALRPINQVRNLSAGAKCNFAFRPVLAALTGALAGLLLAAVPLWRQNSRFSQTPAPPAPAPPSSFHDGWLSAKSTGSKASAELRAAELAETLTADECRAATEAALAAGQREALPDLLCRWASLDGAAAFAWLETFASREGHSKLADSMRYDAGSAWAASDPAGFADWMEKKGIRLVNGDYDPEGIRNPAWQTLLQHDLRAAIRVAGNYGINISIGIPLSRNDLRPAIRTNADAAAVGAEIMAHPEWLANIESGKPLYLLVALRECWQEIDPDAWDRWAAAHPDAAEKSDNQPVHPGIQFLRSTDRAATATRLLDTTPPEKLEEVTTGIMRLWDDPEAAGHWLNECPDGPAKSAAARAYALEAVKEDPAAALHWANAIGDPAGRARTQRRVFTAWHDADPAAAAAWLPQSGWSEAQIQAATDIMSAGPKR